MENRHTSNTYNIDSPKDFEVEKRKNVTDNRKCPKDKALEKNG